VPIKIDQIAHLSILLGIFFLHTVANANPKISDQPITPFKLATFEVNNSPKIGIAIQGKLLDLSAANRYVSKKFNLSDISIPDDMLSLIEQYHNLSHRLYQIANHFSEENYFSKNKHPFVFNPKNVSFKAPIKYPYNLLAAAANYKSHADEMSSPDQGRPSVLGIDIDNEGPHMFAKSPRSTIIDPGEPYYIADGVNIDWEAELAIIIGQPAYKVTLENAHDHVFGYSIIYDVSIRGGKNLEPLNKMIPGVNWFRGKSSDRAAPFGPYIVPKEFIKADDLRITTKVNGVTKQDGNSKDMIYNENYLIRFVTSVMTLYPGDIIATGTPDGVGAARKPPEFLKPGDLVEISIEGIGTLVTPMKSTE